MNTNRNIDHGRAFDWGRASADYAKYRDIYPPEFYRRLLDMGLCTKGQAVLDLGDRDGGAAQEPLPLRRLLRGDRYLGGTDRAGPAAGGGGGLGDRLPVPPGGETDFPDGSFDVVTACQCFFYFDHALLAPRLSRILKRPGRLAALYMAWLPGEDPIAAKSEELVQRYNPGWTGGGETRHPIAVPDAYEAGFEVERQEVFDLRVPFTREGWNGRMKACRGIGASLPAEEIARFDREHLALLERIAPPRFEILHYAAVTVLRTKETGASAPQ